MRLFLLLSILSRWKPHNTQHKVDCFSFSSGKCVSFLSSSLLPLLKRHKQKKKKGKEAPVIILVFSILHLTLVLQLRDEKNRGER